MSAFRVPMVCAMTALLTAVAFSSISDAGEQFPRLLREVVESESKRVPSRPASFQKTKPQSTAPTKTPSKSGLSSSGYWKRGPEVIGSSVMPPGISSFNGTNVYRKPTPAKPDIATKPTLPLEPIKLELGPPSLNNSQPQSVIRPEQPEPASSQPQPLQPDEESIRGSEPMNRSLPQRFQPPTTESIRMSDEAPAVTAKLGDSTVINFKDSPVQSPSRNAPSQLKARILAPREVAAGEPMEFGIEIANYGDQSSNPYQVRLWIPEEFTITRFDQDAWLDDGKRTVTFTLGSIPGKFKQVIRLRGVSHHAGMHQVQAEIISGRDRIDATALALMVDASTERFRNANSGSDDYSRTTSR